MRIIRRQSQNGGGILNPNIRFPERRCSCRICNRPSRLLGFFEILRRGFSGARRERTACAVVREEIKKALDETLVSTEHSLDSGLL